MYYVIHLLRGIAAILVAGFHLNAASENEGFDTPFFKFFTNGSIGVDIIFASLLGAGRLVAAKYCLRIERASG